MFWGLILEPNHNYRQITKQGFHLSMASLDISDDTCSNDVVQVRVTVENGQTFLLCNLSKHKSWQAPLDITFYKGSKLVFSISGSARVHLTGSLLLDNKELELDKSVTEISFSKEYQAENLKKTKSPMKSPMKSPRKSPKKSPRRKASESKESSILKRLRELRPSISFNDDDDDDDDNTEVESETDNSSRFFIESSNEEESTDEDSTETESSSDFDLDEELEELNKDLTASYERKKKQYKKLMKQLKGGSKQKNYKQKLVNEKEINNNEPQTKQQRKNKTELRSPHKTKKREGGVVIEDIRTGKGPQVQFGKSIAVYMVGRLKDGKKFDSQREGDGFKFKLGKGEVIKGWDVGIPGMRLGGKRRIIIPPNMGYGTKGSPPFIPGNSTIIYDIELKKVY